MKHVTRGLARIFNAFVEALNNRHRLPKYVIVVPDKDIITSLKNYNIGLTLVMGAALHYLIRQFDIQIQRRHLDLQDKKPGAIFSEKCIEDNGDEIGNPVLPDTKSPEVKLVMNEQQTKFVWVRMLKRPYIEGDKAKAVFGLRGKFNSQLEECLSEGEANTHRIMSIEVRPEEFDRQGNLTLAGKEIFWKEVNRAMRKLDNDVISLFPRKFHNQQNAVKTAEQRSLPYPRPIARKKLTYSPAGRKLPTPPPRRSISTRSPLKKRPRSSEKHGSPKKSRKSRSRSRSRISHTSRRRDRRSHTPTRRDTKHDCNCHHHSYY